MVDGSYFFTPAAILVGVVSRRCRFSMGGSDPQLSN
jgi:hypothetical protein